MKLDTCGKKELEYQPGDHVGIYPENNQEAVEFILSRLTEKSSPDNIIQLELAKEETGAFGKIDRARDKTRSWKNGTSK